MTEYIHAFWLALLQGITEFLPVSSSGHLVLLPRIVGWPDQGRGFDVAVHVGTLLAVVVYFRADLRTLLRDWFASLPGIGGGEATAHSRLAWAILIATAITVAAGVLFGDLINQHLRTPLPVAAATLIFGVLLGLADRFGARRRQVAELNWKDVLVIGCAQALALVPGTSRSGVTISAGLLMGLTRDAAARFSFLMAIPVIALAGVWQARGLLADSAADSVAVPWGSMLFATAVSAAVALVCIHWFLRFLQRHSLLPFVIYRIALGVAMIVVFA